MIRPATIADIPWMMSVAKNAYREGTYDETAGRNYWRAIIENRDCLLLRGERAVMGVAVLGLPYLPDYKVGVTLPIASLGDAGAELMQMTRQAIKWAKERGARHVDFAAITGADLGPLARRFGGVPISPAYRVECHV